MRVGVGRGTGDPQEVVRSRRAQNGIDIDSLFEQALTEMTEILLVLNHYRNDRGNAVQHGETACTQLAPELTRHLFEALLPLRLLAHDFERRRYSRHRSRRQAGGEYERTRRVLEVIDHRLRSGDEATNRRQRLAERAHDDVHVFENTQ